MYDARPCTHGERVSRLETESFIVTLARYQANARVSWHEHQHRGLTLILAGSMRESFVRRTLECEANALIAKPPDARHRNAYGTSGADCLILEVRPERARAISTESDLLDRIAVWKGGGRAAIGRRLARELRTSGLAARLTAEALALELIASAMRAPNGEPAWLRRAQEFVHDEFRSIRRVSEIAAVAGVHPVHLAREFRLRLGRSVADYLRDVRLEWAGNTLLRSNRTILDVALESGYADQSHFTRAFAAHFGVPPARYRTLQRDETISSLATGLRHS